MSEETEVFESAEVVDALPQRQRYPVTYMVIYPENGQLKFHEAETRKAAKKFVNSLPDPGVVDTIYRISMKIELKKKVVMDF